MPLGQVVAALSALSTGDWIAIVAIVFVAVGAVIAYQQLRAGRKQLEEGQNIARAQFLLDMDRAFDSDGEIRVRLAKSGPPLTTVEWRMVKRYMAHFERVSVFVLQGLLEPKVVHRLYGPRFRNIVRNTEVRDRLLFGDKAAHWVDSIALWRVLDDMERETFGTHLYPEIAPPVVANRAEGVEPCRWKSSRTRTRSGLACAALP